jgi:hypothetical protein
MTSSIPIFSTIALCRTLTEAYVEEEYTVAYKNMQVEPTYAIHNNAKKEIMSTKKRV